MYLLRSRSLWGGDIPQPRIFRILTNAYEKCPPAENCVYCMKVQRRSSGYGPFYIHYVVHVVSLLTLSEPYDYPSWCLILVFSVHATGASIFIYEWLSPRGLDQGRTSLRGNREVNQGSSDQTRTTFTFYKLYKIHNYEVNEKKSNYFNIQVLKYSLILHT